MPTLLPQSQPPLAGSVLGGGEGVLHAEFHGEDPVELGDASERDVVAVEVVVQEDSLGLCESVGPGGTRTSRLRR